MPPLNLMICCITKLLFWKAFSILSAVVGHDMGGRRKEKEGRRVGQLERVRHRWCILWTPSVQGAASAVDAAGT